MLPMHYVMWLHSSMQTPVELVPRQLLNSALLPFELQQTDLNLTRDQWLQVLHLFRDNIAAVDAYLAIEDADLHTDFILGAL